MGAEVVLGCLDLQAAIEWFEQNAGFRMLMISPADDPSVSVLEGHGIKIRLDSTITPASSTLRIPGGERRTITAPNGTVIEFVPTTEAVSLPANQPEFVHSRFADADFGSGRAGMGYRDLIPKRQGGRFIASHISIPTGGPVPDYVHHHHIRFQLIFCHAGWADLVYEDQGPPFRMEAGDCVLQPPHIRHRVLATSDEFEVVEIGCPAVHDTLRDHDLELPNPAVAPDRDFDGQRFVWHQASAATTTRQSDGSTFTSFGIDTATDGLATVGLIDNFDNNEVSTIDRDFEFLFWFVRSGSATLADVNLNPSDSVTFAPAHQHSLTEISPDFQVLQVKL